MRDKARNVLTTSKPIDPSEISGTPVASKAETRTTTAVGDTENKGFPPELQWLFMELDTSLKAMGVDGITQEEAFFLVNILMTTPGMLTDKRTNAIMTPGRAHRKTPQVYLEAQREFEAQQTEQDTKELKIGSRGASTQVPAQPGSPTMTKKAAPPQIQTQQNWALQNRILDLEKQLARAQAQAARKGDEGQRLAELNLATSVESREVLLRTQRLEADLKRTTEVLGRCESEIERLESENRKLEKNLATAEEGRAQWESKHNKLELEGRRLEAECKNVNAQVQGLREKLDAEKYSRTQLEQASRHNENESKGLATQLEAAGKDSLHYKETIGTLELEIKRLEKVTKEDKEKYSNDLANLESKFNSQIDIIRKQKEEEEKQKEEALGLVEELQHKLKRLDLHSEQDKNSQATEHEALLRQMRESFAEELQEGKKKASREIEALTSKNSAEIEDAKRKHAQESAARAEVEKKSQQLESEVRDLSAKLENATKALSREEALRARISTDLKHANESMEKTMASKEEQFSSELESLRNKVEKDTQAQLALENDIASKQLQLTELTASTTKQIAALTQKLDEQTQLAKRIAQEVEEHKRAHADAARDNAEHASRIAILAEEKSLSIQTMKELVKENEELEADNAELRARIETLAEMVPAPVPVPEPPMPPAAPPPAQVLKKETSDLQNGLATAAGNLKKAPSPSPKTKDARQQMLDSIQSQNITLKTVRKSLINNKPGDNETTSIVGILARALIKLRKDISEDNEEEWDE